MTADAAPIVVPLDGSSLAERALPYAALFSRIYGDCPVHLLHVAEPETVQTKSDLENARDAFVRYASNLASKNEIANPVYHLAEGSPADAILRYKWEHHARLVVLATHGRGGITSVFVGSVTDKVVRGARVPVVAVPAHKDTPAPGAGPVLVALDGSPQAEAGLAAGREIAALTRSDLYLLRAYSVPPPVGVEFSYYSPEVLAGFETSAKEYVQEVANPGEYPLVVQATASVAIEEAANKYNAGLIVMTSSGKGLARRVALGSTTERVLHSVHRPLLIVPVESDD